MRGLLAFACRAFPRDYRARRSGELVDTALLAANGSAWRAAREALSLVVAGLRQRLHASAGDTSVQDGVALLAGVLALVNLAVALYGISPAIAPRWYGMPPGPPGWFVPNPYVIDWWWIAFGVAAVGIVGGLAVGNRKLALGAALANLGVVGYDALFLATKDGWGHMSAFAFLGQSVGYPVGQEWLAPAALLALAVAAAPLRRRALLRVPLTLVAAVLLVVIAREDAGGFIFLQWPAGVVVVLAAALGWLAPRLAVVGVGICVALAPYVVEYMNRPAWAYHEPIVTWVAAPGLALGIVLPLAYLAHRRLT